MYVLRHHDVTGDVAAIPTADSLEFSLQGLARYNRVEEWQPPIATEGDEMQAALLLVAFGLRSHVEGILISNYIPPSRKNREKSPPWAESKGQPQIGNSI
jgi:hypothetical protein